MKEQAAKVLKYLSSMSEELPRQNKTHDVASAAGTLHITQIFINVFTHSLSPIGVIIDKINSYKVAGETCNDPVKSLYSTYDNHKRGHITYKDFSDSLLLLNTGINKNDAYNLATNIDKHHCGVIEYSSILSALNQLKESNQPVAVDEGKSNDGDNNVIDTKPSGGNAVVSESSEETKQPEKLSLSIPLDTTTIPVTNEPVDATTNPSPSNMFTPKSFSTGHDTIKTNRKVGYRVHDNKFKINDQKFGVTDLSDNVKDEYRGLMKKKPYHNSQQVSSFNPYEYYDASNAPIETATEIPDPITTDYYNRESNNTNEILTTETADTLAFVHDHAPVQRDINTIEHTIITQLNGNLVPVRQAFKKKDISGSGYINIHEFDSALGAAGIDALSKQDIHDVFTANTSNATQTVSSGIGYTAGKVIEIDDFLTKLTNKSINNPKLPPKIIENSNYYKTIEERRVCKRVVDNAMKLNDYHGFFKHYCDHHVTDNNGTIRNGWMTKNQLKNGLEAAGLSISNREMNIFFEKLDTNHCGKINLRDFDKLCIQSLEENRHDDKVKKLSHCTKNNTFKSDFDLHYNHDSDSNGYDHLMKSKSFKQDDIVWSKLKHKIQSSPAALQATFQGTSTALSVPEMITRMNDLGVTLCGDDSYNISDHLRNELKKGVDGTDEKVTLSEVCKVFDIPMKEPPSNENNKTKLVPPDEYYARDGGTFGASHLSLHANDTSRTSFYDSDEPFPWIPNNRKKRVSSKYNNPNSGSNDSYSHGHTGNFWKFENNNEIDIFRFGMYPLPSYRHTETNNNHNNDVSYSNKERKQDATELYLKRATELHSIRDDTNSNGNGGVIIQDIENEYSLNSNTRTKLKTKCETSHIFDEIQHYSDTRGRTHYNENKTRRASSAPPGSRISTQTSSIVLGDADANMDKTRKFSLKKHPSSNNFNTTSFGKGAPYATETATASNSGASNNGASNSGAAAPGQHVPLHKFPVDHLTESSNNKNEIKTSLKMVGNNNNKSSLKLCGDFTSDENNSVRTYRKMVPNNSNIPRDQRPYGLDTDTVKTVV